MMKENDTQEKMMQIVDSVMNTLKTGEHSPEFALKMLTGLNCAIAKSLSDMAASDDVQFSTASIIDLIAGISKSAIAAAEASVEAAQKSAEAPDGKLTQLPTTEAKDALTLENFDFGNVKH